MAKKIQVSKEAKARAAAGSSKGKKKKWAKAKARDKLNNAVLFEKSVHDKLMKEIPTAKLITPAVVSERLKCRVSLARRAISLLADKGLIKPLVQHSALCIYTRATTADEE